MPPPNERKQLTHEQAAAQIKGFNQAGARLRARRAYLTSFSTPNGSLDVFGSAEQQTKFRTHYEPLNPAGAKTPAEMQARIFEIADITGRIDTALTRVRTRQEEALKRGLENANLLYVNRKIGQAQLNMLRDSMRALIDKEKPPSLRDTANIALNVLSGDKRKAYPLEYIEVNFGIPVTLIEKEIVEKGYVPKKLGYSRPDVVLIVTLGQVIQHDGTIKTPEFVDTVKNVVRAAFANRKPTPPSA